MALKQIVDELDREMVKLYDEYVEMHKEFDKYRGQVIQDDQIEPLNKILHEIQGKFNELFYGYNFISYRYQSTCNVVTHYNEFIESLKKAGAKENKDHSHDAPRLEQEPVQ